MLITLIGKMGTGKTTQADFLVKEMGFTRVSFAGKMKRMYNDLFPNQELDRNWLQTIGAASRALDPKVWLNQVMLDIENTKGDIVIDDCRYRNELEHVIIPTTLERGGGVWNLKTQLGERFHRRAAETGIDPEQALAIAQHALNNPTIEKNDLFSAAVVAQVPYELRMKVQEWQQAQEHESETDLDSYVYKDLPIGYNEIVSGMSSDGQSTTTAEDISNDLKAFVEGQRAKEGRKQAKKNSFGSNFAACGCKYEKD